jgi:hypothetical protein
VSALNADPETLGRIAAEEPDRCTTVPGFPELRVYCWDTSEPGKIQIDYCGRPDDLVAAGIVRRCALVLGGGKRTGKRRTDATGTRWYVTSWRRTNDKGRLARCYSVRAYKALEALAHMPGALEALAVGRRWRAWEQRREAALQGQLRPAVAAPPARPPLVLVVDNTRKEQ